MVNSVVKLCSHLVTILVVESSQRQYESLQFFLIIFTGIGTKKT